MAITSTTDGRIEAVEGIICYLFTNKALLREALQAAGCYSAAAPYRIDGNKDLALVGDAALRLALVSDGYDKHACRGNSQTHSIRSWCCMLTLARKNQQCRLGHGQQCKSSPGWLPELP